MYPENPEEDIVEVAFDCVATLFLIFNGVNRGSVNRELFNSYHDDIHKSRGHFGNHSGAVRIWQRFPF